MYTIYNSDFNVTKELTEKLNENFNEAGQNKAVLTEKIVVAGLEGQFGAGGYKNTDTIDVNTPLEEILKNILSKEYYPDTISSKNHSYTLSIGAVNVADLTNQTVEVGTLIKMGAATLTAGTDKSCINPKVTGFLTKNGKGYVDPVTHQDVYKDEYVGSWTATEVADPLYKIDITNPLTPNTTPSTVVTSAEGSTYDGFSIAGQTLGYPKDVGSYTITFTSTGAKYSAHTDGIPALQKISNLNGKDSKFQSTAIPAKDATPDAPTNATKKITIKAWNYLFRGEVKLAESDKTTEADKKANDLTADQIRGLAWVHIPTDKSGNPAPEKNPSNSKFIERASGELGLPEELPSSGHCLLVFAIPSVWKLTNVQNGMGIPAMDEWKTTNSTLSITCGEISVNYTIYYRANIGDALGTYKEFKITK